MDDIVLKIRGRVDEWRVQRQFAYMTAVAFRGSNEMPSITSFLPLNYDYELQEPMEDLEALYNRVSSQWN